MKFLFFILLVSLKVYAKDETQLLKMTLRQLEDPDRIVELSPDGATENRDKTFRHWQLKSKKFDQIVHDWLQLPGSVDQVKNCPRNYIRFELTKGKMKRTEFVCYDNETSTRRAYLKFSNRFF